MNMNSDEIIEFLNKDTFTGKIGTINKDGTTHITPIWYILDEDNNIIFTTSSKSLKGVNLIRDPRISMCIDDQTPPFSFVIIKGIAKIFFHSQDLLKLTTRIAERYMGKELSLIYGKRNAVEDELVIKIIPTKIIGQKNVSE